MTQIYFIRHGQTDCNAAHRHQVFASKLSDLGRRQAAAVATRLARLHFDALYASDLQRAASTAEEISAATALPVTFDQRLREIDVGIFKGRTADEARALSPDLYERWRKGDPDAVCPQGESRNHVAARAASFLAAIAATHPKARILAVTHGEFLRALLGHILQIPAPLQFQLATPNTGINILSHLPAQNAWELLAWADTAHLATLGEAPVGLAI